MIFQTAFNVKSFPPQRNKFKKIMDMHRRTNNSNFNGMSNAAILTRAVITPIITKDKSTIPYKGSADQPENKNKKCSKAATHTC